MTKKIERGVKDSTGNFWSKSTKSVACETVASTPGAVLVSREVKTEIGRWEEVVSPPRFEYRIENKVEWSPVTERFFSVREIQRLEAMFALAEDDDVKGYGWTSIKFAAGNCYNEYRRIR